jgi:hypothetical protein
MGYAADAVRGFSLLTNKNVPSVVGSRVWLLTGEGTPRIFAFGLQAIRDQRYVRGLEAALREVRRSR